VKALEATLAQMTSTDLIEAAHVILEESADRAENFASVLQIDEPPGDLLNEGLALVLRLREVYSPFGQSLSGACEANRMLSAAERQLKAGEPLDWLGTHSANGKTARRRNEACCT
jgi:hypothetical protein